MVVMLFLCTDKKENGSGGQETGEHLPRAAQFFRSLPCSYLKKALSCELMSL